MLPSFVSCGMATGHLRFRPARLRAMGEWDPNEPDLLNQVFVSFPRVTYAGYPQGFGLMAWTALAVATGFVKWWLTPQVHLVCHCLRVKSWHLTE